MSKTNFQFTITLPDGWEDNSIFTFMGPDVHGVRHMLNLTIDKNVGDHTVDSYARERIQLTQHSIGSADTLKDAPRTLPNGLPVHEWIYKTVPVDGKGQFHQQVYAVIDKRGYHLLRCLFENVLQIACRSGRTNHRFVSARDNLKPNLIQTRSAASVPKAALFIAIFKILVSVYDTVCTNPYRD